MVNIKNILGPVALKAGSYNLSVKFFEEEIFNEGIEAKNIVTATRKNGRIYISTDSSSEIQYSLTGSDFTAYVGGIENKEAKTIFVKVGENEPKEIEIVEYSEILDIKTSSDTSYVTRTDGDIYIYYGYDYYDIFYYSFDKENWTQARRYIHIQNIEANTIYIWGTHREGYTNNIVKNDNYSEYKIRESGQLEEVTGIYNENGNSYIFGQEGKYSGYTYKDSYRDFWRTQYTVIDDENKMQNFSDNEILDITSVSGDVFILKNDSIVYKVGNSYNDLKAITNGTNFKQLDGVYAVDNENNIWKCEYNYDDNTYYYSKCDYNIESEIAKISLVIKDNNSCPYILYTNGKAVILKNDGTIIEIADDVIDISSDGVNYFALQKNAVIYNDKKVELQQIVNNGETPIQINKQCYILTDNGSFYKPYLEYDSNFDITNLSYDKMPNKTDVAKMGNYTYQDEEGYTYYIETDSRVNKEVNNIKITKDESKLDQNKVEIKVEVPENTYTVRTPDGSETTQNNITYEVTENGEYAFEFIDVNGYNTMRVVHVTNIQNRKETKVPEVTVINGKISLKSDDNIEYSLDNVNWVEYTSEITYTGDIYARIKNDNYECSVLKITINEDGKLNVENTESREIQGGILTNAIGMNGQNYYSSNSSNIKVIEYEKEVEEKQEEVKETEKNLFDYISEIADNIIYSFSSTDGKYAGCYFEDNITEITYKDMNEDIVHLLDGKSTIGDATVDYAVILKETETKHYETEEEREEAIVEEEEKLANGEIYKYELSGSGSAPDYYMVKEITINYAYIDTEGNLVSNIDIVNKLKEQLGENTKYTKIVGDGMTFYTLTEEGEVYIATYADNGTYDYLQEKLGIGFKVYWGDQYHYIISKLDLKDIVNIYDTCTALNKDGKIVSLIKDNEEDVSVVQELQKQTDKYLLASHLGLKDGKLYNFDNVKEGVEVTAGKVVKSDENGLGVYSETNKTIKLFDNVDTIPSLQEGESYIDVQSTDGELPEFVDIAEYRNSYLAMIVSHYTSGYYPSIKNIDSDYTNAEDYAMVYALSSDGELWAYIGDYVVDTGVNLDFYGPTANYSLSNTNWTNKDITLDSTENTTNNIIKKKVYKGEEEILNSEENTEQSVTISTNGDYIITITDGKERSYTSKLQVQNIDKVKPVIESTGEVENKVVTLNAYDVEDETGNYAKSGIAKVEVAYEEPTENTVWQEIQGETDSNGVVTVKLRNDIGNKEEKTVYVRTIDNAGNVSDTKEVKLEAILTGRVIVKYQDTKGNTLKEDLITTGEIGDNYKVEKVDIDKYELKEVVGNEEGSYTYEDQIVIYKYEKVQGNVIVKYQDTEGNTLKEDLITTGEIGDSYKVEKVDIDKYELKEVVGNEEGSYTYEDQIVIYKYEKITGRIIIRYLDPDGNPVDEDKIITGKVDDPYSVDRIEIDGYELIEVIGNETGVYKIEDQVVMYKYAKITNKILPYTGQTITAYIVVSMIAITCICGLIYCKVVKKGKM